MRSFILKTAAAAACACASLAAHAIDGTVTINGTVSATTCTINVAGSGSPNATVNLPIIASSALAGANSYSGGTQFTIALSGCTTSQTSMAPFFESAASTTFNGAGRIQTPLSNVEVQILNSLGNAVNLAGSATVASGLTGQNVPTVNLTGSNPNKTATSTFYARYYSTAGGVGTGTFSVNLAYSITYQ